MKTMTRKQERAIKAIKSITLRQKTIKALQREIKYHRDELGAHLDHLVEMQRNIGRIIVHVRGAVQSLDQNYAEGDD